MAAGLPDIRELFGGAMRALIPSEAKDVSEVRQVPDNQEVFCHPTIDQSIMVDILEYQTQVQNENAAKYHFEDIASCNESLGTFEVISHFFMFKITISKGTMQEWIK
ncbi:hypothetical protein QZH41_018636 [Actinostola sp. cb2023]|nr:hypothetical protein QZH41_018636 [Actinostola sp. cb2023]